MNKKIILLIVLALCLSISAFALTQTLTFTRDAYDTSNTTIQNGNYSHLKISTTAPYNSLVGYWSFDKDAEDLTDYGNDGTLVNQASYNTSGKYGSTSQYDGASDYISIPVNSKYSLAGTNNYTISLWVYMRDLSDQSFLIYGTCGAAKAIQMYYTTSGSQGFAFTNYAGQGATKTGTSGITANTWYHITARKKGTNNTIYLNGIANDSVNNTQAIIDSTPFYLGFIQCLGIYPLNGFVDDLIIFNTSLTDAQILDIYNNQSSRFKPSGIVTNKQFNFSSAGNNTINVTAYNYQTLLGSSINQTRIGYWNVSQGYNISDSGLVGYWPLDDNANDLTGLHNGTVSGATLNSTGGIYGGTYNFDNTEGNYITINTTLGKLLTNGQPFAISWWENVNSVTDAYQSRMIFEINGTTNKFEIIRATAGAAGAYPYLHWGLSPSGGNMRSLTVSRPDDVIGQWRHFTITGSNPNSLILVNYQLYENGVSQTISTGDPFGATIANRIGYDGADMGADAKIDEVMIFNRSLSADEVKQLYIKGRVNWQYTNWNNYADNVAITDNNLMSKTNFLPEFRLNSGANNFYTPLMMNTADYTFSSSGISSSITAPAGNVAYGDGSFQVNVTYSGDDTGCIATLDANGLTVTSTNPLTGAINDGDVKTFTVITTDANNVYGKTYNINVTTVCDGGSVIAEKSFNITHTWTLTNNFIDQTGAISMVGAYDVGDYVRYTLNTTRDGLPFSVVGGGNLRYNLTKADTTTILATQNLNNMKLEPDGLYYGKIYYTQGMKNSACAGYSNCPVRSDAYLFDSSGNLIASQLHGDQYSQDAVALSITPGAYSYTANTTSAKTVFDLAVNSSDTKINWSGSELNLNNTNPLPLDSAVKLEQGFAYVNSTGYPGLNSTPYTYETFNATITMNNVDCSNPFAELYYSTTAVSKPGTIAGDIACPANICQNRQCIGNTLTFTVPHFTGYAYGSLANLTIYDEVEGQDPNGADCFSPIEFFANYTNSTSGAHISGASCNITIDGVSPAVVNQPMADNIVNYKYTLAANSFPSTGDFDWNVTCNNADYNYLAANDTIFIELCDELNVIPEFSTIGVILTIIVIGMGTMLVRKHKEGKHK